MFRAVVCILAGLGLLLYEFPILRGERRSQRLTPDQKIWRVLMVITIALVLGIGGRGLYVAILQMAKKSAAAEPASH